MQFHAIWLAIAGLQSSHWEGTRGIPKHKSGGSPRTDVSRPMGQSTGDETSRCSSRLDSIMTSSAITPSTTPTKQADRSISHSPSSNTCRDNPWNKKYILTLDGGGVRGLSTLYIIQQLMVLCSSFEQSQDPLVQSSFHPRQFEEGQGSNVGNENSGSTKFLPVHYFDYVAGTSTGGLIAIMLSRLRMNIDDCIREYQDFGEKIFGQPRKLSMRGPIPWNREKYDHRKLEEVIKDVVKRRDWKQDQFTDSVFYSNPERCRTIVFAVRENASANAPYLFRTYEHLKSQSNSCEELNPGRPHYIPIWQIARATTAAPTYFKPSQINKERFVDGGYGYNNPTLRAFSEVEQVHGEGTTALILSIGTGRPTKVAPIARKDSGLINRYRQMIKYTAATTTDSEPIHEHVKGLTSGRCTYERLNVDGGLGDINLGEWRIHNKKNMTLETIREQTLAYLDQPEVSIRMEKVAKMLVKNRQERSRTPRWDIVATGHRYHCPEGCDKEMIFTREDDLRAHLCGAHGFSSTPRDSDEWIRLEKAINTGRILHAD
ncbi:5eb779df-f889-406e-96ec-73632c2f676e [Sclerotinia trifoliorum]|uniref:5eb779df-f889-406e-96ec-73632c2f676e n=1 Tax=Sclerotinia trifoliorum TaxID=28548 RepID=A0A8H2ZPC9_9HELO|nr:5eb779df-f889-406e-96ec-73632c2f676e [Sclerotinia trifoliorum]